ncbi:hypothetical protein DSO57_1033805 [Entomophthora muscae]|uniref:Uncharacterized protein n=1 Tax=Entomophthora muscae TaxID=34485 RepID=A0ACC2SCN1_9FUNG|nr:hypothetical protein DSO57_1033805 [Entomophthora muscae]
MVNCGGMLSITSADEAYEFGKPMLKHFQLEHGVTYLNSAGFGVVPWVVRDARMEWMDKIERAPDRFMMDSFDIQVEKALEPLAAYIGAPHSDVVFVNNITMGLSTITRSLDLKRGDRMLVLNSAYSTVRVLLDYLVEEYGVILVEFNHREESNQDLLANLKALLKDLESQNLKLKCALFEAITSSPALILPYEEMARLIKRYGALVIVDGAHCFGQVPLKLGESCIDFFVTNLHKWGFTYRPAALMYVRKEHQKQLYLPMISTGYVAPDFKRSFSWPGTHDFSLWLCTPAALRFRQELGDSAIREYCHTLAWQGGHRVAKILGTKVLGDKSQMGFMANVLLPVTDFGTDISLPIIEYLWSNHKVRTKIILFQNQWYTRISAQIFNTEEDFVKLATCLLEALHALNIYSTPTRSISTQ